MNEVQFAIVPCTHQVSIVFNGDHCCDTRILIVETHDFDHLKVIFSNSPPLLNIPELRSREEAVVIQFRQTGYAALVSIANCKNWRKGFVIPNYDLSIVPPTYKLSIVQPKQNCNSPTVHPQLSRRHFPDVFILGQVTHFMETLEWKNYSSKEILIHCFFINWHLWNLLNNLITQRCHKK